MRKVRMKLIRWSLLRTFSCKQWVGSSQIGYRLMFTKKLRRSLRRRSRLFRSSKSRKRSLSAQTTQLIRTCSTSRSNRHIANKVIKNLTSSQLVMQSSCQLWKSKVHQKQRCQCYNPNVKISHLQSMCRTLKIKTANLPGLIPITIQLWIPIASQMPFKIWIRTRQMIYWRSLKRKQNS